MIRRCARPVAVQVVVELVTAQPVPTGQEIGQGVLPRPRLGRSDGVDFGPVARGQQRPLAHAGQIVQSRQGAGQFTVTDGEFLAHLNGGAHVVYSEDEERHSLTRASASKVSPARRRV